MFEVPRRWFKRNRAGIAVGAGLLGAAYLAGQYVVAKITETRQHMNDERIAKENLRRRFRQNQEDCTYTVLALLPTAADHILQAIPVEDIIRELQSRKSDKRPKASAAIDVAPSEGPSNFDDDDRSFTSSNYVHASQIATEEPGSLQEGSQPANPYSKKSKTQLWNQLKMSSMTRAFTMIYTLALLALFTRIQLNLLGRRTYLSSVVSLAAQGKDDSGISLENRDDDNLDQDYGDDFDTNRKYLTFSWWLLHRGWMLIMEQTETTVKEVFAALTPREDISFEQLSVLVLEVRKQIEGASEEERKMHDWLQYLLPPQEQEETVLRESGTTDGSPPITPLKYQDKYAVNRTLRQLLDETADLIDSPAFTSVLTLLLDSSFSLLVDEKIGMQAYKFEPSAVVATEMHTRVIKDVTNDCDTIDHKTSSDVSETQRKAKLATVLAIFTRQAHAIGLGGNLNSLSAGSLSDPHAYPAPTTIKNNEYLAAMELVGDLEAFAAVIYSSHFDVEELAPGDVGIRQRYQPVPAGDLGQHNRG